MTNRIKSIAAILGIGVLVASCSNTDLREREVALQAQKNTIDSMKIELMKQELRAEMNEANAAAIAATKVPEKTTTVRYVATAPKKKAVRRTSSYSAPAPASSSQGYGGYSEPVQTTPTVYSQTSTPPIAQQPQQEEEKKGWSAKAKGAVIGAGVGAVAGAVIHKRQRAVGAVVGGVLGAGAGTGIGAVIDKKNGR